MLTMSDFSPVKSAFKIYPASLHEENDSCVFIADILRQPALQELP